MKKLIIISDILGTENDTWLKFYTDILEQHFEIVYYDCRELANIDKSLLDKELIHQQFLNGGIISAVDNLVKKESNEIVLLGFSIGGYIAWKAVESGLKVKGLIAISSTRLRFETNKPTSEINLYYGALDTNKPLEDWSLNLNLNPTYFENESHDFYMKKELAEVICRDIINYMAEDKKQDETLLDRVNNE